MLVQVGEGIHRVTGGVTNFYLIAESGKFTVIDAGTPHDWALLASSLGELGAGVESLDAVLLAHAHVDHVGFAEQARNDVGAQVWIHQADAEAAHTGKFGWKNEGHNFSYLLRTEFWRTAMSLGRRGAIKMNWPPSKPTSSSPATATPGPKACKKQ